MIEKVRKEEIPKLIRRVIDSGRLGGTDSKRANTLAELFSKKEELNKLEVIKKLFPDKELIKAQNSFKKFVSDFNQAAKAASLCFWLASQKDNRPVAEKTLWVEVERKSIQEELITQRLKEKKGGIPEDTKYLPQHYIPAPYKPTTLLDAYRISSHRIVSIAQLILGKDWFAYPEDVRNTLSSLTVKFEAINRIDLPQCITCGFEVLCIGPEGENFTHLLEWIEEKNVKRAHLSIISLFLGIEQIGAFINTLRVYSDMDVNSLFFDLNDVNSLFFDLNLDTSLLYPENSRLLYNLLKRYKNNLHQIVFEVMEDTKPEHIKVLNNLLANFPQIRICLDDIKDMEPQVRAIVGDRAEFVKLDFKHCQSLLEIRGEAKEGVMQELLRHTDRDKPIVFEGIDKDEYYQFLKNNLPTNRLFYIQGYSVHPDTSFQNYLMRLDVCDSPHPSGYCLKKHFQPELPAPKSFLQEVLEAIDKEGLRLKKPIEKLSDYESIIELDNIPDKIGILEEGDISLLKEYPLGYIVMKNPPKDKELEYIEYSKFHREREQPLIVNLDDLIKHLKTYISLYYRGERFFLDEERFPQRYWIIPDAYTRLKEWIKEPNIPYCFILGDYGVGKTFLCRMFSLHIHTQAKKGEKDSPLPLYIDMANIRLEQGIYLKNILGRYIYEYLDLPNEYVDTLLEMVKRGRVILIFDGFDEHAAHLKYKDAGALLRELRRGAQDTGKVIIACRTHYFKHQEEEKRKLKGEDTILAREVIKPESTLVIHLSEFTQEEVKQYLSRMLGDQKMDSVYQLIQHLHDLPDLAKRPILLNLIIRVLPQIEQLAKKKDKIFAANLYELLIKEWVYRDENKHFIQEDIKVRFMEEVAWRLWNTKSFDVNLSSLDSWLREYLLMHNYPTDWEIAQIDIRTATFLSRDEEGRYRFIHRSFEEFFLARRIKEGLSNAEPKVLDIPRLSVEIVRFVLDLLDSVSEDNAREVIEKILEGEDYTSLQKENSVLILSIWNKHKAKKISPKELKLSHVNLSGMDLSGIDLSDAELSYADLSYANLQNAILKKADLSFAKLDEANLFQADLSYANLNNASLKRAKLSQADLSCAKLNNADLSASLFTSSNLQYADISNTRLVSAGFVNADLFNTKIDGSYPKNARFLSARLTDNQVKYLKSK
jgi:uncharacterized protein YjbI with pentapeptide repeats/EAL domain-containing protein (putative c-di-GMP-specific phosphodiesterase class I)